MSLRTTLVSLGALLASILGVWLTGRKSGKDAVRTENAEQAIKDARKANAIDNDVKSLSDSDLERELRNQRH